MVLTLAAVETPAWNALAGGLLVAALHGAAGLVA